MDKNKINVATLRHRRSDNRRRFTTIKLQAVSDC